MIVQATIKGVFYNQSMFLEPLKEATGRIVGFQLIPLSALGRPRIGEQSKSVIPEEWLLLYTM